MRCIHLALVGWLLFGSSGSAAAELPLDLAFGARQLSAYDRPALSPDGTRLAFAVVTPAKEPDDTRTLPSGAPVMYVGHRLYLVSNGGPALPIGPEGALSFSPAWSPDGSRLAFYCDAGGTLRLWLYEAADGKVRQAAPLPIRAMTFMRPAWTPDGRSVLVPVGKAGRWSTAGARKPDGPTVRVHGSGDEKAIVPKSQPAPGAEWFGIAADLVAVPVGDGEPRTVVPATADPAPAIAHYSPSGRFISYVTGILRGDGPTADLRRHLAVVRVADGQTVLTLRNILLDAHGSPTEPMGLTYAWDPSADRLVLMRDRRLVRLDLDGPKPGLHPIGESLGDLHDELLALTRDGSAALVGISAADSEPIRPALEAVGVVPLDGGPAKRWPLPPDLALRAFVTASPNLAWQPRPNTATLTGIDRKTGQAVVDRLDLATGALRRLRGGHARMRFHAASADHALLVGSFEDYRTPPNLYPFDADAAKSPPLTQLEPRLADVRLGETRSFETTIPLHDGKRRSVRTAVLLPPGWREGEPLATIVSFYGGADMSEHAARYGGRYVGAIPAAVFTTRGYVVLVVDAPLGPDGQPGQPVEELRDAVLPQVYRAAELGYTDVNRVAIAGQSYGGYGTAALISATNLFRAAVAMDGVYDLAGTYAWMGSGDGDFNIWWSEKGQGRMGRPLWDDTRRYVENSPYFRADRIHTPLLMLHGSADRTCPVQDAEKLFNALRRLGRTAQLAVYEGEGHVLFTWEPKNAIDATRRMLDFLGRHLKSPERGEPRP
jgi:dipeptidyl aminopeptidase/acylaminoacyl peptidase